MLGIHYVIYLFYFIFGCAGSLLLCKHGISVIVASGGYSLVAVHIAVAYLVEFRL